MQCIMASQSMRNKLLYNAVIEKDLNTVKYLLKRNANPNELMPEGPSAFHMAVGTEDVTISETLTELLLQHGGSANIKDPDGITPLHIAAAFGRDKVLDILLGSGGDPSLQDDDGQTCYDLALASNSDLCVALLKLFLGDIKTAVKKEIPGRRKQRKSIFKYTEKIQAAIDQEFSFNTTFQLDVTSPDHPILVRKAEKDSPSTQTDSEKTLSDDDSFHTASGSSSKTNSTHNSPAEGQQNKGNNSPVVLKQSYQSLSGKIHESLLKDISSIHSVDNADASSLNDASSVYISNDLLQDPSSIHHLSTDNDLVCGINTDVTNSSMIRDLSSIHSCLENKENCYSPKNSNFKLADTIRSSPVTKVRPTSLSDVLNDLTLNNAAAEDINFSLNSQDSQVLRDLTLNTTSCSCIDGNTNKTFTLETQKTVVKKPRSSFVNIKDYFTDDESLLIPSKSEQKQPNRYAVKKDSGFEESPSFSETILGKSSDLCPSNSDINATPQHQSSVSPVPVHPDFYQSPRTSSRVHTPESSPASDSSSGSGNSVKSYPVVNYSIQTPSLCCSNYMKDLSDISVFKASDISNTNKNASRYSDSSSDNETDSATVYYYGSTEVYPQNQDGGSTGVVGDRQWLKRLRNMSSASSTKSTASTCSCKSGGHEETVLSDVEYGVNLVERCLPIDSDPDCSMHSGPHQLEDTANSTLLYDWKEGAVSSTESCNADSSSHSVQVAITSDIHDKSDQSLRKELEEKGDNPGPITLNTRKAYEIRLARIRADPTLVRYNSNKDEFCPELNVVLKGGAIPTPACIEVSLIKEFENPNPNKMWREGTQKTSFNYLLMDPRVTQNLPSRNQVLGESASFECFVRSIFYVGKGKRSRPYAHFKEAIKHISGKTTKPAGKKVEQIISIWEAGLGVISLHIFQNVIPVEAYTRESCLIQALGLNRLTNVQPGQVYGNVTGWSRKSQRQAGVILLQKAFQIFLLEGERQIRAYDIKEI